MQDGAVYLKNAEVVSPSQASCNGATVPDFPYPVVGAASGMVGEYGVVCGGAAEMYVNCKTTQEGERLSQRLIPMCRSQILRPDNCRQVVSTIKSKIHKIKC